MQGEAMPKGVIRYDKKNVNLEVVETADDVEVEEEHIGES